MQELIKPQDYQAEIRRELQLSGRIERAICNRWMLGWPEQVKKLIETGEYLTVLKQQAEWEMDAIAENTDNWLSETEKVQLAGLSLEA